MAETQNQKNFLNSIKLGFPNNSQVQAMTTVEELNDYVRENNKFYENLLGFIADQKIKPSYLKQIKFDLNDLFDTDEIKVGAGGNIIWRPVAWAGAQGVGDPNQKMFGENIKGNDIPQMIFSAVPAQKTTMNPIQKNFNPWTFNILVKIPMIWTQFVVNSSEKNSEVLDMFKTAQENAIKLNLYNAYNTTLWFLVNGANCKFNGETPAWINQELFKNFNVTGSLMNEVKDTTSNNIMDAIEHIIEIQQEMELGTEDYCLGKLFEANGVKMSTSDLLATTSFVKLEDNGTFKEWNNKVVSFMQDSDRFMMVSPKVSQIILKQLTRVGMSEQFKWSGIEGSSSYVTKINGWPVHIAPRLMTSTLNDVTGQNKPTMASTRGFGQDFVLNDNQVLIGSKKAISKKIYLQEAVISPISNTSYTHTAGKLVQSAPVLQEWEPLVLLTFNDGVLTTTEELLVKVSSN